LGSEFFAAVAGAIVGAIATGGITWLVQSSQERRQSREAARSAQPIFGVQRNASVRSEGAHRFEFLIANAGATCTSLKLFEGDTSHGEAAILESGNGVCVNFSFAAGEPVASRKLTVRYKDARGDEKETIFLFRAVDRGDGLELVAPTN